MVTDHVQHNAFPTADATMPHHLLLQTEKSENFCSRPVTFHRPSKGDGNGTSSAFNGTSMQECPSPLQKFFRFCSAHERPQCQGGQQADDLGGFFSLTAMSKDCRFP